MNSELSNEAQELVNAGKEALRPSPADRARVLQGLQARLQPVQNLAQPPAPAAEGMTLGKLAAITAGFMSVVAAIAIYQTREIEPRQTLPLETPSSAPATPSVANDTTLATNSISAAEVVPESITSTPTSKNNSGSVFRPGSITSESDRLGEEVVLLTRAEKLFHAGNLSGALAAVEEHQRKFPKGALAPERTNLRARVLCGLGRSAGPQSEAGRVKQLPKSKTVAAVEPCRETK